MKFLIVALLALAGLAFAVTMPRTEVVTASSPGSAAAPLIGCPNVDGSTEPSADPDELGGVRVGDILKVVQAFFHDAPMGYPDVIDSDYVFLYDRNANGQQRVDDILNVVQAFFLNCPRVDTEVARATQWILTDHPELLTESESALEAAGYYRGSTDVPGQGIHYVSVNNWDGNFDPRAPEGLVYHGGLLAAQLYVTDGTIANGGVGWGTHDVNGAWPPPTTPHDVDLEGDADGPQCDPACSWYGTYDGWHLHYYLCTVSIGTTSAAAIPGYFVGIQDAQDCDNFAPGSQPQCSIPITTQPCWRFGDNVGWMGHLWNWLPNPNQVPDLGGNNGRFADCIPDAEGWKSFNCPA
jgi:hypothetical protein